MAGANLSAQVSTAAYVVPAVGPITLPCRRAGPRYQADTPRMLAQRGSRYMLPSGIGPRRDHRPRTRRGVPVNGPGGPGHRRTAVGLTRGCSGRLSAVRHLLRQPDPGPRALGPRDHLDAPGTRGINIPVIDVATGRAAPSRGVRTMGFALEGKPAGSSARTSAPTPASATSAPTTVSSKVWSSSTAGRSRSSHHRRPRPGPHDAIPLRQVRHRDEALMPRHLTSTSRPRHRVGPIVISQACEFDYSGTQACRVLKAEGLRVS